MAFYSSIGCKTATPHSDFQIGPGCYTEAAVATAHPLATSVGLDILANGGNAYDAAIAVQFALAVVYPRAGNIGGGGFMVHHSANGAQKALDFREKAPLSAHADMYLDSLGLIIEGASQFGHRSVGVPGVVDGMCAIHERHASMPWEKLLAPAIKLAQNGYTLTHAEAATLNDYQTDFYSANGRAIVFSESLRGWNQGDSIFLPQLAEVLVRIAIHGREGFYRGKTAELMIAEVTSGGGDLGQHDLDRYSSRWLSPVKSKYRGHTILGMPPPSSGGVAVAQLLYGAEQSNLSQYTPGSAESIHLMAELERRVFADRATHLGDPDFWNVPMEMLLDDHYIRERNSDIDMQRATDSQLIQEGQVEVIESVETTHFSIIDKLGNAVAITTTLNGNYGSKVMVDGAQFFLNNEMDDFSIKPGSPNMYGLVGGEANAIAPEKRMLSSMSPTIVLKDHKPVLILGTPGGSTIITSVFQIIVYTIGHHLSLHEAVDYGRVHHQWLPDRILYEQGRLDSVTTGELMGKGHVLEGRSSIGRVDAIHVIESDRIYPIADSRGDDAPGGIGSCW